MTRRFLAPACALLLTACSPDGPTVDLADLDQATLRPEPVMFSATDADSEVILFGTFHILPQGISWQSPALTDAIARSDEAWFELPADAQNDPTLQQLTMQLGTAEQPLTSLLSTDTSARLAEEATRLGLPMPMLEQMQPWFAAITLPVVQMMNAGFDPEAGAEAVLEPRVAGLGRSAFETAEQQLRFFADMDQDAQIEMLEMTLDSMADGTDLLTRMANSWASGEVDMLEEEVVGETKRLAPDMYDVLFTQRNAAWTDRLVEELEGSGVDFVAVGAGHLLGPDSVPVMLAERGYDVTVLTARD